MEDLVQKLRQYVKSGTPAERRIARYFSEHLNELPFETAASVADRLDLSPMTVGRFLRTLGYQGLDGMKVHIRDTAATASWESVVPDAHQRSNSNGNPLAGLVAEQIDALHHLHNLISQPQWAEAAGLILSSGEVFVASHPRLDSLTHHFCYRLGHARDRVRYLDGMSGSYMDLLAREGMDDTLLIIIDCRRFTKSRILARSARRSGCKVLLLTGRYTDWATEYASTTLALSLLRSENRENLPALIALLECLAEAVILLAGAEANIRGRRIAELEATFGDPPNR
ncbi:MurR/RpiR family transcriptional regulator [Rhizobium sp. BK251]|uniref:MurR/RpiR family transcriptional regulator n=1 Tax=Rhizobium sp. BK251 TaxID=2512125 RepID=UPI001042CAA8|nr:MurR/RpiR family transcriptional regulator [Rhizobium sp. BK251]TCL69553.1 RpiR family transcriptional regulator [Rhizobium sp. BK251]